MRMPRTLTDMENRPRAAIDSTFSDLNFLVELAVLPQNVDMAVIILALMNNSSFYPNSPRSQKHRAHGNPHRSQETRKLTQTRFSRAQSTQNLNSSSTFQAEPRAARLPLGLLRSGPSPHAILGFVSRFHSNTQTPTCTTIIS